MEPSHDRYGTFSSNNDDSSSTGWSSSSDQPLKSAAMDEGSRSSRMYASGSETDHLNLKEFSPTLMGYKSNSLKFGALEKKHDSRRLYIAFTDISHFAFVVFWALLVYVFQPWFVDRGNVVIEDIQQSFVSPNAARTIFDTVGVSPGPIGAVVTPAVFMFVPGMHRLALQMMVLNCLGRYLKWALLLVYRQGRPFWISTKIKMWHCPVLYGNPSGHAMLWLLFYYPLGKHVWQRRKRFRSFWARLFCILITVLLICEYVALIYSRLYVGTHYPHSLFLGAIFATMLLTWVTSTRILRFSRCLARLAACFQRSNVSSRKQKLGSWGLVRLLLLVFFLLCCSVAFVELILLLCNKYSMPDPSLWEQRSEKYCSKKLDTRSADAGYGAAGGIWGLFFGLVLRRQMPRRIKFSSFARNHLAYYPKPRPFACPKWLLQICIICIQFGVMSFFTTNFVSFAATSVLYPLPIRKGALAQLLGNFFAYFWAVYISALFARFVQNVWLVN